MTHFFNAWFYSIVQSRSFRCIHSLLAARLRRECAASPEFWAVLPPVASMRMAQALILDAFSCRKMRHEFLTDLVLGMPGVANLALTPRQLNWNSIIQLPRNPAQKGRSVLHPGPVSSMHLASAHAGPDPAEPLLHRSVCAASKTLAGLTGWSHSGQASSGGKNLEVRSACREPAWKEQPDRMAGKIAE